MLTAEQVIFVGLLASAIIFVLKLLFGWFGYQPGRGTLTILLYVVSLVLGGLWTGVYLPTYTDPVQFIADLLALAGPVVAMATLIYNILYKAVVAPVEVRVVAMKRK